MPRAPRVVIEGALCYVTVTAADGRLLFKDAADYHTYLDLLSTYQPRHQATVYAYALLPGQVHLCLELPSGEALSALMHDLSSRYTHHANRRDKMTGPLFQQRFKSTLLEKVDYLAQTTRYVHLWPSYARVASQAEAHRWTSVSRYLRPEETEDTLVRVAAAEALEAMRREQPSGSYADYLCALTDVAWAHFGDQLQRHRVLGSPDFVARAEAPRAILRTAAAEPAAVAPLSARHTQPVLVTASVAVAVLAIGVAAVALHGMRTLKQTVEAMSQERMVVLATPVEQVGVREAGYLLPLAAELDGSLWRVRIRPLTSLAGVGQQAETVEFRDGKIFARGPGMTEPVAAPFRVLPGSSRGVLWETIQSLPKGDVAYWRGEMNGQSMHGTITLQRVGEAPVTYTFIGNRAATASATDQVAEG